MPANQIDAAGTTPARQDGEVANLIRSMDWTRHPLGTPETWPVQLRMMVGTMLSSPQAMFLAWGPKLRFFYKDAYAGLLGLRRTVRFIG